jgi:DNA-binding SARP family transcriptional activator
MKRLRQAFEPSRLSRSRSSVLPSVGDGYVLHPASASVDLWEFRGLLRKAGQARNCDDDAAVFTHLGEAVSLWRDIPFADVAPVRDLAPVRALSEQYACAVSRYAEAGIRTGHAGEVLSLVEQAAQARPLDEAAQALLMRAYHATARRSDGFAVYQRTQQALAEELGVDPGRELRATYEALLRDKLAWGPAPGDQSNPSKMMLRMLLALGVDPAAVPESVSRRAAMLRGHLDAIADLQPSFSTAP